MRSADIRERFLSFFESRGHHRLPSASLIPHDDPSLLFTVAGMVPLKRFITGEQTPPGPTLCSCQKCFRGSGLNDDIASVGDSSHHTFFEMLGNWSIGDYFKEGAIRHAWDLLTEVYGLDPQRLWPSIYPDDSESHEIWTKTMGIPEEKISRLHDNWWQAGPTGPCGYDSEIYWDWGAPCSCGRSDCKPEDECGGDRWTEIWNLVFMEFDQAEDGTRTPLPQKTVDTGMGLERIATVLQGVRSNYETDLFRDIVAGFRSRAAEAEESHERTVAFNVLADHVRGATFLVADGVFPANEGRGYVLRRVVRRAAVHGRRVGLQGGLAAGVPDVVAVMGETYPELRERQELIEHTLRVEEEAFGRILEEGTERLEAMLADGHVSGEEAFKLHDTFGFPIELTTEIAAERGIAVDRRAFDKAMAAQRERSKASASRVGFEGGPALPSTTFVGYQLLESDATVLRIGVQEPQEELEAGGEEIVVLDVTPFYAESGGQVGDTGELTWEGGSARVLDTTKQGDSWLHRVRVERGTLRRGAWVHGAVDAARRAQVARHHSATHLLHRSLRELLGETVVQRGSYVGPDYTTFDFAFHRALTPEEIREVEHRVNAGIRRNHARDVLVLPIDEARRTGAVALFGEKYGDKVRVVDFGGWARELCGGTHVDRTGDVGAAVILSESSVGQGVRRIEMVAGEAAERRWQQIEGALREAARTLKARPDEVPQRIGQLIEQNKELRRRQAGGQSAGAASALAHAAVEEVAEGLRLALLDEPSLSAEDAVAAGDRLFSERLQGDGVAAVLGGDTVAVKVGGNALARGLRAGDLVRAAAEATGGRGGGRPEFARGGLKDSARRSDAVAVLREAVSGNGRSEP